jgi:DNA-binding NarL/FixJ family response regulator
LDHEPAGEATQKESAQLPKPKLSQREIEVLQLLADGFVNREIGRQLFISEETVKSHVRHVLAKLEARSRANAVAIGFRRGLIS